MQIKLTPEEIKSVATQLQSKGEEIDQAVSAADGQVGNIRSMESPRLGRDIETWDRLKASIKEATSALRDAAKELNNLAEENIGVNQ